jgi:hypothetical protein
MLTTVPLLNMPMNDGDPRLSSDRDFYPDPLLGYLFTGISVRAAIQHDELSSIDQRLA